MAIKDLSKVVEETDSNDLSMAYSCSKLRGEEGLNGSRTTVIIIIIILYIEEIQGPIPPCSFPSVCSVGNVSKN